MEVWMHKVVRIKASQRLDRSFMLADEWFEIHRRKQPFFLLGCCGQTGFEGRNFRAKTAGVSQLSASRDGRAASGQESISNPGQPSLQCSDR